MAKVTDLSKARRERLADVLAERLRAGAPNATVRAQVQADGTIDGVAVDEWRAAARRAGRQLGWPIRTYVAGGTVVLVDNRARDQLSEAERNQFELRLQAAARAMDDMLGPAPR